MRPQTLLFVLLGTVPIVVVVAGVVAFLLMRAGYGVLIWAVVPFLVSMLVIAGLGALLGRAAGGRRGPEDRGPSEGRSRGQDGV
jgi:ABC-type Na+ efflux pump permease subunit